MALSTTVSQKKQIKRRAPRGFLKRVFKLQKPHLRLEKSSDLLVHLSCLLFVHRLAEESRTNACENKCGIINKEHVLAAAKKWLNEAKYNGMRKQQLYDTYEKVITSRMILPTFPGLDNYEQSSPFLYGVCEKRNIFT
nr:centromere protein W isoform X2 [Microcebus murinus]